MEEVIKKFVNYFFEGADDSVKEYVKGTLNDFLSEVDQEEYSSDIVLSNLTDFLPPGQDPSTLPKAVQQLKNAVAVAATLGKKNNEENEGFAWLKSPTNPTTVTDSLQNNSEDKIISSASFKYSDLKVSAAEFTPPSFSMSAPATTGTALGLAKDLENLDLDTQNYDVVDDGTFYNEKEGEEELYSYDAYPDYPDYAYSNGITTPDKTPLLDTPLDRDAILAVLLQNFPAYSPTALEEMFISCGNSLPATIDMLYRLENELYGVVQQQQQQQWQQQVGEQQGRKSKNDGVEFSAEDFPTLGGGKEGGEGGGNAEKERKNSSNLTTTATLAFGANYAKRAKAAAHLPAPRPQKPTTTAAAAGNNSTGTLAGQVGSRTAAPVWQAQGIEKFSTGISVAAEYAEARSEARDHARARNVCFEAATQAYISGNKALAKELGAKGRWHNEEMKAAHARAAEETFSKRNAATLGASTHTNNTFIASSSIFGSASAPPTIDLHGLHVSEALHHLDKAIESLQQRRVSKMRLVVGVGQHGKVPARLKSAVEKHLTESWGLRHREPYEGLLEVILLT